VGSIPEEVIGFFQLTNTLRPDYDPGVDSASNRNEFQESSYGVKALATRKVEELTAICEQII
jgi:hypothetical protein